VKGEGPGTIFSGHRTLANGNETAMSSCSASRTIARSDPSMVLRMVFSDRLRLPHGVAQVLEVRERQVLQFHVTEQVEDVVAEVAPVVALG
jgi:hypothetical protein